MRSLIGLIKGQAGPGPVGLAYRELEAVFQKSPITVPQFEHLLSHLDNNIKSTYQAAGLHHDDVDKHKREKEERNNIEKTMLIKATIPPVLEASVKDLLTTAVNALKEEVNVAELYFTDMGWLGLTDDNSSRQWREKHPIDSVRKTPLKKDTRTKRCIRCGALTEDALPFKGANMMIMTLLRYCICGSWFMIGEEEGVGNSGF
jgi:mediator of RNA polymerase II transcription subunit 16